MTHRFDLLRAGPAREHFRERFPDERKIELGIFMGPWFMRKTASMVPCRFVVTIREFWPEPPEVLEPDIAEINAHTFCVPTFGNGSLAVFSIFQYDFLPYHTIHHTARQDIKNRYLNRIAPDGKTRLGHWWLRHPHRRTYQRLLVYPRPDLQKKREEW